jgi:hypothetical protein
MLALVLVFLLLASSGCSRPQAPGEGRSGEPTPLSSAVPSDTFITLKRTRCFGECPVYQLEISADGKVVFEGVEYVKTKGRVEGSLTQGQLRLLISEFEKAKYFSLRDSYVTAEDGCPTYWTDNPSALTSIRISGKSKSIAHYYGCQEKYTERGQGSPFPRELTELERKIDLIAGTKQWVE